MVTTIFAEVRQAPSLTEAYQGFSEEFLKLKRAVSGAGQGAQIDQTDAALRELNIAVSVAEHAEKNRKLAAQQLTSLVNTLDQDTELKVKEIKIDEYQPQTNPHRSEAYRIDSNFENGKATILSKVRPIIDSVKKLLAA